jgi:putative transposase
MDDKGRWVYNVFIERLWRSLKYEEVYVKAYDSIPVARKEIWRYFDFYNQRHRHMGLKRRFPDEFYGVHYRRKMRHRRELHST